MIPKFSDIYFKDSNNILGFHGCEKEVADKIFSSSKEHLKKSKNSYDWLGEGIYFWLNDPVRAFEWAKSRKNIIEPAVVGAVIDLGVCLNLNERSGIKLLQAAYDDILQIFKAKNISIKDYSNKKPDEGGFNIVRPLDCLVINHAHTLVKNEGKNFDTVVSYFQEGKSAFEGSDIKEKSHVQICVVNEEMIKGYFKPREK